MQALSSMAYFCSLSFKGRFSIFSKKIKTGEVATTIQDIKNQIIVFHFNGRVVNIF